MTQGIVHRTAALAAFLKVLDEVVGRQAFGEDLPTPKGARPPDDGLPPV